MIKSENILEKSYTKAIIETFKHYHFYAIIITVLIDSIPAVLLFWDLLTVYYINLCTSVKLSAEEYFSRDYSVILQIIFFGIISFGVIIYIVWVIYQVSTMYISLNLITKQNQNFKNFKSFVSGLKKCHIIDFENDDISENRVSVVFENSNLQDEYKKYLTLSDFILKNNCTKEEVKKIVNLYYQKICKQGEILIKKIEKENKEKQIQREQYLIDSFESEMKKR